MQTQTFLGGLTYICHDTPVYFFYISRGHVLISVIFCTHKLVSSIVWWHCVWVPQYPHQYFFMHTPKKKKTSTKHTVLYCTFRFTAFFKFWNVSLNSDVQIADLLIPDFADSSKLTNFPIRRFNDLSFYHIIIWFYYEFTFKHYSAQGGGPKTLMEHREVILNSQIWKIKI